MELIDRYLQAVRFWLPKTQQEDLLAELSEDLHSQVEEQETELGRPLDEAELSAILKRCGSPIVVASRFQPQRHLIGPALFPIYGFVLKMVLLWILASIFIVGPLNLANTHSWGRALAHTIGDLWSNAFVAAGVITLVFAVIEGTQAHLGLLDKWNPSSLPALERLEKQERKPSLIQSVCALGFGSFWLVWLLLVPFYPVLILGWAAAFLKAGPIWHTFYVPIVALAVVGLLRSGIGLARPQWTWFPSWSQLLNTFLTLVVLKFMINAASQTSNGVWHPFVVLADGMQEPAHYAHIAAILNASIMICLASVWLGLCIAAVIQTWQFLRHVRQRRSFTQQPAQPRAA